MCELCPVEVGYGLIYDEALSIARERGPGNLREIGFYACLSLLEKHLRDPLPHVVAAAVKAAAKQVRDEQCRVFESLGLKRNTAAPHDFATGTWTASLAEGPRSGLTISGIIAVDGDRKDVTLSAHEQASAAVAWRKIARTTGVPGQARAYTAEWREAWNGFYYRDCWRLRQRARGVRLLLSDQLWGKA